jgi:hypothetical protein
MEIIKYLNLELVIRYGVSGFTAILMLIIFPCLVHNFKEYIGFFSNNILFIVSISFVIGYFLDTLKLYNITRGYTKRRDDFLRKLSEILDVNNEEASVYFSVIMQASSNHGTINLERKNAEWHYLDTASKIFVISAFQWCVFLLLLKLDKTDFQINPYT